MGTNGRSALRHLSAVLLWFGGGLALLVVAAVAFMALAGEDFYRRTGVYLLESALDRNVRLDGTFAVTLDLEPTLVVTDISIANAPWAEKAEMVRVERLEVQVELVPLFSGVVVIPRLVVGGATVDLEIAADGRGNWESAKPEGGDRKNLFSPLVKVLSVENVAIGYTDRRSGSHTDVFLESLQNRGLTEESMIAVEGKGRVDETPFRISGKLGSVEDALAAAAPYPLQLSIDLSNALVELTGTAKNLPHAEGFDVRVTARTSSLGEVLQTLGLDLALEGHADASARLTGDLESLAAENVSVEIVDKSGPRMKVLGSLSHLWSGDGLDLRFDGRLGPEMTLLVHHLPDGVRNFERLDFSGRVKGNLEAPEFDDLRAEVKYLSGADLSVTGRLALDLSAQRTALSALSVKSELYVPDTALLDQLLGTKLPELGAIHATSNVSWAAGSLAVDSLEIHAAAPGHLRVKAKGSLGTLSASGFDFRPDPQLEISASVAQSRPLVAFVDASLPELGPIDASAKLAGGPDGAYRVDDIRVTLGSKSALWVEAEGKLGSLDPDGEEPVGGIALTVDFASPSVRALARMFGRDLPELGKLEGSFVLKGSSKGASVSDARVVTTGPTGLDGAALGDIADLSFSPGFAAKGIVFDISAKSESTQGVSRLVGQDLPEWGPVRASATLEGGSRRLSLDGVNIAAGSQDPPVLQIFGKIGNLLMLKDVDATGSIKVETTSLLEFAGLESNPPLGQLRGSFSLSDEDGSLGLESLKAYSIDTDLFSLSLEGKFDDFANHEELVLQAVLKVPSPPALGRALDLDAGGLGPFSFKGDINGGEQQLRAEGAATVGTTRFSGTVTGSLVGERPSFHGTLSSPVVRLADFGLGARAHRQEVAVETAGPRRKEGAERNFGEHPIPFDYLKEVDLDLDIKLDDLEGVGLEIGKAEGKVNLTDGLLRIDPLQFAFFGGGTTVHLFADARPVPPTVQLHIKVDNSDLGELFKQLETDVPLEGKLDALVDVRAAGTTLKTLAGALGGQIDLAVERGRLGSRLLDLVALDFQSWLLSKALRRGYTKVECFAARLQGENGREKVELLLLDTPNVRVMGQGEIDLRNQTINIKFDPEAKNRRLVSLTTPFSIKGPLANPSIKVSKTGIAARTVGEILQTPFNFLLSLFPASSHNRKHIKQRCLELLWPTES
jgi:uncharacterized protein involved in outer membrane biogenesis